MPAIIDFVIELQGDRPFGTDGIKGLALQLAAYPVTNDPKNPRRLEHMARGASNSGNGQQLDPAFTKGIVAEVQKIGASGRIGLVCISGYSKGATYALQLAIDMTAAGVPVTYIGLGDLPLFPFGNIPAIAGFPTMVPSNDPVMDIARADLPPRTSSPPEVTGPAIASSRKFNYYQNMGNGMKPSRRHPRAIGGVGWWWSSNMQNDEIHGEVDGWTNTSLAVASGGFDADYHSRGDAEAQKRIALDISVILASQT